MSEPPRIAPSVLANVRPIIRRIDALNASPNAAPIRKQHLISVVLLKRSSVAKPKGLELRSYDLKFDQSKLRPPETVGWSSEFVSFRSQIAEQLWSTTENRLNDALLAVDSGSIFKEPELVAVIKDAMILHFVRSPETHRAHIASWRSAEKHSRNQLMRDPSWLLAIALQERGIGWTMTHSANDVADMLLAESRSAFQSGALFQSSLERLFAKLRATGARSHLEISICEAGDFVLADNPALSFTSSRKWPRVPFGDAGTIAMPLGPHVIASLGPFDKIQQVDETIAQRVNEVAVSQSTRHLFFHPGSNLDESIRELNARLGRLRPPLE